MDNAGIMAMSKDRKAFTNLPVEVLDMIAFRLDKASFLSLMQTCTCLKRTYESRIFSNVVLRSQQTRDSFAGFIKKAKRLVPFVKSLEIAYRTKISSNMSVFNDVSLATMFPNLRKLKLQMHENSWSLEIKRMLKQSTSDSPFQNLEDLTLQYTWPSSMRIRWSPKDFHQLCELPRLSDLTLIGFRFYDISPDREAPADLGHGSLRSLCLSHYDTDCPTLKKLLTPLTGLTRLTLTEGTHVSKLPSNQHGEESSEVELMFDSSFASSLGDALSVLVSSLEHLELIRVSKHLQDLTLPDFTHFPALENLSLFEDLELIGGSLSSHHRFEPLRFVPHGLLHLSMHYRAQQTFETLRQLCNMRLEGSGKIETFTVSGLLTPMVQSNLQALLESHNKFENFELKLHEVPCDIDNKSYYPKLQAWQLAFVDRAAQVANKLDPEEA